MNRIPISQLLLRVILIGLGFKIALVPFHMWTPDVYEGAPTHIAAFMATGVKAAGFAVMIRIFIFVAGSYFLRWQDLIWVLAVVTMTVGNIIALVQDNVKRMLAYSSIAHAGYILVAFTAGTSEAVSSIIYYLATLYIHEYRRVRCGIVFRIGRTTHLFD